MANKERADFSYWLSGKINTANQGVILDHELGEYIAAATAPAHVFLNHTERRAEFNKKNEQLNVHKKALDQALADPNDPFTYARVKTHLNSGLCELDDYDVVFKQITVDKIDGISGLVVGRKTSKVPMRMRRA